MARIIESYDFTPGRRTGDRAYPIAEWFDGRVRVLEPGRDFNCKPGSLANYLYRVARQRGVTLHLSRKELPSLVIQAERGG